MQNDLPARARSPETIARGVTRALGVARASGRAGRRAGRARVDRRRRRAEMSRYGVDEPIGGLLDDALIGVDRRARAVDTASVAPPTRYGGSLSEDDDDVPLAARVGGGKRAREREETNGAGRGRASRGDAGRTAWGSFVAGQLPGRAVSETFDVDEEGRHVATEPPAGWDELCGKEFDGKKSARGAVVDWYCSTSACSARLIVDKWQESKVRYVLRCCRSLPKRQDKTNVKLVQQIRNRCSMAVCLRFDRERNCWQVAESESSPRHSALCEDHVRPNVSSALFAQHLTGIENVPIEFRAEFVARRLKDSGLKVTSGTKQRAVSLALERAARARAAPAAAPRASLA